MPITGIVYTVRQIGPLLMTYFYAVNAANYFVTFNFLCGFFFLLKIAFVFLYLFIFLLHRMESQRDKALRNLEDLNDHLTEFRTKTKEKFKKVRFEKKKKIIIIEKWFTTCKTF